MKEKKGEMESFEVSSENQRRMRRERKQEGDKV